MSESADAELISRIVADELEPDERGAVAERLAVDAEFAAEVLAHLRMAQLIAVRLRLDAGEPLARRVRSQITQRRASRRQPRVGQLRGGLWRRRSARWLALAAAVVAVLLLRHPASTGAPVPSAAAVAIESDAGERIPLAVGEAIDAGDGPRVLRLLDAGGARLVLAADSRLRLVASAEGRRFDLEHGGMDCATDPLPADRPLLFAAGPVRVATIGAAFRLQHAAEVDVRVERGMVAVAVGASAPFAVTAGQGAAVAATGTIRRYFADPAQIDDGTGYAALSWSTTSNPSTLTSFVRIPLAEGPGQAVRMDYRIRRDPHLNMWAVLKVRDHGRGLAGAAWGGFGLLLLGAGDGRTLVISVIERSPAGDEFWSMPLSDDRAGWRRIEVPWTALHRSTAYQPEHAADDGFSAERIIEFSLSVERSHAAGDIDSELTIADLRWLPATPK